MATDAKSSSKNGVTLTMEEATMLRIVVKHMYKCHTSGSSIEPSSKQSTSIFVSKKERKMLDKLVPNLKIIDNTRVAFTVLTKVACALTSKMTGEPVEYENTGYDEEDVCADYFTSLVNQ